VASAEGAAGRQENLVLNIHPPPPFEIVDCALVTRLTGHSVQNLREFRDALLAVDSSTLDNHFWGGMLRPHFDDPEFHNDFARWARRGLHDRVLSERLAAIDPAEYADLERLRVDLVDLCEDRLAEVDAVTWAPRDRSFHFQSAHLVILLTGRTVTSPDDLPDAILQFSRGSVFSHLIDARRRNDDCRDDLRRWLADHGPAYQPLVERLGSIDPLQGSLHELKRRVAEAISEFSLRGEP
jgi:hypothetical protein